MKNVNFKPQYHTDWNIQQFITIKIGTNLMEAGELNKTLISYQATKEDANRMYGTLWEMWDDIGRFTKLYETLPEIKKSFQKLFTQAETTRLNMGTKVDKKLVWQLSHIYSKIKLAQQMTGLGMNLQLNKTQIEKFKESMGVKNPKND